MNKYLQFIADNTDILTPGTTITNARLCRGFGIQQPNFEGMTVNATVKAATTFTLKRATAYTKLNKYMRQRGVVIKQETTNSVTKFNVSTEDEAERQVRIYEGKAAALLTCSVQLQAGHSIARTAGYYNNPPIPGI